MNKIKIKNKTYQLAENWAQLRVTQYNEISSLFFQNFTPERFKLELFQRLTGVPLIILKDLDSSQLMLEVFPLLSIFEKPPTEVFRKFEGLYGPLPKLANVTLGEFATADIKLRKWQKTQDLNSINEFCACFFRPLETYSRKRKAFNSDNLAQIAKIIAQKTDKFKFSVILYFMGCVAEFPKLYPNLYPKDKKGEPSSWRDTIQTLAQTPDKVDTVSKNLYIHSALAWLDGQAKLHQKP